MGGFSTYPFASLQSATTMATAYAEEVGRRGDTVVGNDVWLGFEAQHACRASRSAMARVIGSRTVVSRDVPRLCDCGRAIPRAVARRRFDDKTVEASY
jgi:virginiamycin A acetyltransferase